MSAVITYKSSDPSAPVLNGLVGSLTNLLNKCLVTGYGAQLASGWSCPFAATNQAVFKGGTASTGLCLQVLDDASGTGLAKEAKIRGYEVMTSTTVGTGPFSISEAGFVRKSATTDSTPREWMLFADDRSFYLYTKAGEGTLTWWNNVFFGDIVSYRPNGDPYGCAIITRAVENSAVESSNSMGLCGLIPSATAQVGHWLARSHTQSVGAVNFACIQPNELCSGAQVGLTPAMTGPNMVNVGVNLGRVHIANAFVSSVIRGYMPGMWVCGNSGMFSDGMPLSNLVGLEGKTFVTMDILGGGRVIMETTPWR